MKIPSQMDFQAIENLSEAILGKAVRSFAVPELSSLVLTGSVTG
jgi:hypothetical protein